MVVQYNSYGQSSITYGVQTLLDQYPFSQKIVSIVVTFSLKIIVRQFLSHFHKDYLTTNFNLTTKNSSLGVLDTTLCDCDNVCQ
jgi:hypothetical protein